MMLLTYIAPHRSAIEVSGGDAFSHLSPAIVTTHVAFMSMLIVPGHPPNHFDFIDVFHAIEHDGIDGMPALIGRSA